MKVQMDDESRKAMIAYRYKRSKETMREAEVMAREGFNNAAVNRLYYACYYAVSALLLSQKVQSHTHAGTKTMFALHIISPGKMPIEIASAYFTLFEKRHTGDYDDFVLFQDSTVQELTKQAITFIESVGNLLPKNNLT